LLELVKEIGPAKAIGVTDTDVDSSARN